MNPFFTVIAVTSLLVLAAPPRAAAHGAGPPAPQARQAARLQTPPPGWLEARRKAFDLTLEAKHLAALAIYESWVARYPDFAEGHLMLGAAHQNIARATVTSRAPDWQATRTTHLEAAVLHTRRGLELAGPGDRFMAMRALVDLYGMFGLNRPVDYERLVREGVTRFPTEPHAHAYLLELLATKGEPIDAAARAARVAMPKGPAARVELAGILVVAVRQLGRLTPALGPALLPEALRLVDEALELKPGDADALKTRGDVQAMQAMVPGRLVADEDGVRLTLERLASAQAIYSLECGHGYYAPTLAALSTPAPETKQVFLAGDLVPVNGAPVLEKYRYRIEMVATPSPGSAASCNGVPAGGSAETFSLVARPLDGVQGRTFRMDAKGNLTDIK